MSIVSLALWKDAFIPSRSRFNRKHIHYWSQKHQRRNAHPCCISYLVSLQPSFNNYSSPTLVNSTNSTLISGLAWKKFTKPRILVTMESTLNPKNS